MIEFHRIDKGIKLSQLEDIEDGDALCTDDALTSTRSNKPITNYCLSHRVIVWKVALLAFITLGMFIITMVCTFSSNEHYVNDSFVVTNDNTWENNFKVESKHGVVATDDYRCSKIGADILAKGGNAMDAAIGSTICLGVVSPGSSGLGGGCFILGYDANSKSSIFIDARETAPMAAHKDMFISDSMKSQDGGLAIAVLAELKGLYKGYLEHGGGVSWTDIVTPSISHALRYTIDATLADHIQRVKTQLLSGEYPELASLFMKDKNTFKTVGDTVENIKLAKTLQKIATYGGDYLNVDMGDVLAAEIQQAGGVITSKDLKAYEPIIRDALVSNVFGHTVYGSPPPSSGGGAVIAILRMFAEFQEPGVSQGGLYYHYLTETFKHIFAMRMNLGDPSFINTTSIINDMTSTNYIKTLRNLILDNGILNVSEYGGEKYGSEKSQNLPDDHGTTHISVIDKAGNAVALTSTINTYFGSKVVSPSTGIIFNNQMDDFSIPNVSNYFGLAPFPSNYIAPGKRPLSSMSPTIAIRNSNNLVRIIGGASGGPRIITGTAQILLNVLVQGMSLIQAIIHPRLHSQLLPDEVYLEDFALFCSECGNGNVITESSIPYMKSSLIDRGHNVIVQKNVGFSACQFVEINHDDMILIGVSDPRKGGRPAAPLHDDISYSN